ILLRARSICAAASRPSCSHNKECRVRQGTPSPLLRNQSLQIARPLHRKNKDALRVLDENRRSRKLAPPLPRPASRSRNCRATVWIERALSHRRSFPAVESGENIGTSVPARVPFPTPWRAHLQSP